MEIQGLVLPDNSVTVFVCATGPEPDVAMGYWTAARHATAVKEAVPPANLVTDSVNVRRRPPIVEMEPWMLASLATAVQGLAQRGRVATRVNVRPHRTDAVTDKSPQVKDVKMEVLVQVKTLPGSAGHKRFVIPWLPMTVALVTARVVAAPHPDLVVLAPTLASTIMSPFIASGHNLRAATMRLANVIFPLRHAGIIIMNQKPESNATARQMCRECVLRGMPAMLNVNALPRAGTAC